MTQKIKYILMPISFILVTNIQSALSNSKFCEIKFNVQGGEQSLEKKLNIMVGSSLVTKKYNFDCYQIGVEHDKRKQPLQEKPIFACCHNI